MATDGRRPNGDIPTSATTTASSITPPTSSGDTRARDEPVVVDAIGKACPMPVIDLAATVKQADMGTVVHLLADDGAAKVDVAIWCRMQRQRLDDVVEEDDHVRFEVTKVHA